ncbi:MAG: hypothetical protein JHC93_06285 [Parachlamydiales bacterium]|nr:hypothetical protein [Parachlamydiales bacterium]
MEQAKIDQEKAISITYTNYRKETAKRTIIPMEIRFTNTEWHPEIQWILFAYDIEKQAERGFALKDIVQWH